jgi:hypothetical protein
MDTPLEKNTTIRQFFSTYKIEPFINNIETNSLHPENITLVSTSPSGIEEYQYNLTYKLASDKGIAEQRTVNDFVETRVVRIKYTDK